MGYRSDVMLFAPKKCIKKIYETAVGKNFESDVIYKSDDGLHALLWKWDKWYGHPAVQEIDKILDEMDELSKRGEDVDYLLLEIGESDEVSRREVYDGTNIDAGISISFYGHEEMEGAEGIT